MNIVAFGVVAVVSDAEGTEEMSAFQGLGSRNPFLAVLMATALFSLTGLPPLAGFIGKFYIFAAVIHAGGFYYDLLAVIGVVNSAISLYYYARVVKAMFLDKALTTEPLPCGAYQGTVLGLLTAPVVVLGVYWQPLTGFIEQSLKMTGASL